MKRTLFCILSTILLLCGFHLNAQETYQFAERDTCNLYLDIFRASQGSETTFNGVKKPTILYVFGGGFLAGKRTDDFTRKWFKLLNDNGYPVITIDYRLGMKGYKVGKGIKGAYQSVDRFELSQNVGVEDVFSAITFLKQHKDVLDIDINNMVLAGSSAGAIITLATIHDISRGRAKGLPDGFNFKGAMSFAGAIISTEGAPSFTKAPCPVLLFHGTADKAVAYKHLGLLKKGLWGSDFIAGRLSKKNYNYSIYRFKGRSHDVASYHMVLWPLEKQFLEENVMSGHKRIVDAMVDDESLPTWGSISMDDIYNQK